MPVTLKCDQFILTVEEVTLLWQAVRQQRSFNDDAIVINCVNATASQKLNKQYRGQDKATNVLTFSYRDAPPRQKKDYLPEHDVAICLSIARAEAKEASISIRDYTALLITHAFIHVTGLDHDQSHQSAKQVSQLEHNLLDKLGYTAASL